MSSSINTILIIGGTSGIGRAFAERFHANGKQVIITGRRQKNLDEIAAASPGIKTYVMDMTDISALQGHFEALTTTYPHIDTVWVNGGIQKAFKFNDASNSSDASIVNEITTNATAPVVLARYFIPFLLNTNKTANFMITSSGLAFVPLGTYPVYCPTKAFIHHFLVGLRQQLKGTNVNVIEIAPPKVETDLENEHPDAGKGGPPSITLEEYVDKSFEVLDAGEASELKEVTVGFSGLGAKTWRDSIGKVFLEGMGMGG